MADSFDFELVSPERLLVSTKAKSVVVPGSEGDMTVLAEHAPVMTTLRPGIVVVEPETGEKQEYVVFGGFADILPTGCTLLAEAAFEVKDLNREEFERRIESARAEREKVTGDDEVMKLDEYLSQLTTLQGAIIPA
jgi:F-type H+-transporting ATPase subunit epsilon